MSRVRRSRLSVTAHCSCRSPDQWRLLGALGNRHDGALGGAGIELGGRESRVSGSVIISFQCATQPTVRATAKVGVTLPARAENDAGIEIDIGIELALDESSRRRGRRRFAMDSPVEEAVSSEPVSEAKFPASWENTGNFVRLGLRVRLLARNQ
jgi:hypothetical protein